VRSGPAIQGNELKILKKAREGYAMSPRSGPDWRPFDVLKFGIPTSLLMLGSEQLKPARTLSLRCVHMASLP